MKAPLEWVKRITSEIEVLSTIPLFGNATQFDWTHFSSLLKSHLGATEVQVVPKGQEYKEGAEITAGLGSRLTTLAINVGPIGEALWIMPEADRGKLTVGLLKASGKAGPMPSEIMQEGFYRYIILEALSVSATLPPFDQLTLQVMDDEKPCEKAFCIDVEITINEKNCWGRLVLPLEFRSKWVKHFSTSQAEYVPKQLAKETVLTVGLKTGSFMLNQSEWETLKPGDFVLLDKGSYDAHKSSGICMLMLASTPLFNVKIKNNKVELIDYAFYYEDNMENTPPPEMPETPEVNGAPEAPQEPMHFPSEEAESVAIKELPLNVTVEVSRIKITLDQLMQLTPGNVLELPIHPDQGVSLTVGGQKVATAELVYLGEQLGVRILKI